MKAGNFTCLFYFRLLDRADNGWYAPYHFSYNDPISYADPSGLNGIESLP